MRRALFCIFSAARVASAPADIDYRNVKIDFGSLPAAARLPRESKEATLLVTGGAGFIGSTMVLLLLEQKIYNVVVVDNLSRSSRGTIERLHHHGLKTFVELDLSDTPALARVMAEHAVTAVIHFAANAFASESVDMPLLYFHNITQNTLSVAEAMDQADVPLLIYSSSCATYGNVEPQYIPVTEAAPQLPVSPYGAAKKAGEDLLLSTYRAYQANKRALRVAMLRYFNVIGADPQSRVGPVLRPELRRYSRVSDACLDAAEGHSSGMEINGVDYLTPDGSVVRDYVHVSDLASAHLAVLEALAAMGREASAMLIYNVGAGQGYSVKELASACQAATGVSFPVVEKPRRKGDPPYVVGDARKIYAELGWRASHTNLTESLEHAWNWRLKLREHDAAGQHHHHGSKVNRGDGRGNGEKRRRG